MSAQELIFSTGGLTVTVGPTGFPTRVAHAESGVDFLRPQQRPGRLLVDGSERDWEFAGLVTDLDESEARYAVADLPELEYTVRNSFAGGWQQRHMLLNTSSAPVRVDDLLLPLAPADGCVGWALTAPGETSWVVQPSHGAGPVLAGELTQGTVSGQDPDGFHSGDLLLPANRRLVLAWRMELQPDAARVVHGRRSMLSPLTELPRGEPYEIDDPDIAVLVDEPLSVRTDGGSQLVISEEPGRYPIELRSARGTSRIDLAWVPSTEELITELSSGWLHGRRSGAGVGLLPGAGAALGLQQAVIARLADAQEDAEDALALHADRLLQADRLSIMDQAFLAQETVRTGDREPLERARDELLQQPQLQPGLGLAATRLCLAELACGGDPSPVLITLRELSAAVRITKPDGSAGDDHLRRVATGLELVAVTGPAGGDASELIPYALAAGAELGSGLFGHRLGDLDPALAVYAAAVLDLLPDALGPQLERHWATTPRLLAQRTRTTALAAALWPESGFRSEAAVSDMVGWLVLGKPIE